MNLITRVRKLLGKARKTQRIEYVEEYVVSADPQLDSEAKDDAERVSLKQAPTPNIVRSEEVIAFSNQGDLESYVKALNVPSEVIEGWISAGVLLPEETRVAAKMIRMIKTKRHISDT